MYEVRPEGTFHRVDSDTSLARAVSKAEAIATTNRRRYVVVEVKTIHVAEPGVVEVLPPKTGQRPPFGHGNMLISSDTFRAHEWETSQLGHGEYMCKNCKITNREAAVINAYECKPVSDDKGN